MADYPKVPLYLFYGTQAEAILTARDAVLDRVVPRDFRNENLTEHYPTSNTDTVKLSVLLDEIAGDFAMISFIADAAKCVIVTNPVEIYGGERAGKKTEKGEANLVRWLENELPQTGHTLMLLAFEDESSGREVDQKSALYQAVQKIGFLRGFSDTKAFFRIEDAIVRRQPAACIQALRDLWKPGRAGGDMKVYGAVVRALRYLMQANIARERKLDGNPAALATLFPGDAQRNLFKAHQNVQKKYNGPPLYRTLALIKAYKGALDVYRALRPRPGDQYVPDAQGLMEQVLLELLSSPRP